MIMKHLILGFVLGLLVLPTAHADPFMDWYKSTSKVEKRYGFPLPKEKINELLKDAEPLIKQGTDEPRFYLQLAAYVSTLWGYYYDETYPLGKYNYDSPESQALIKQYSTYYRKALELDDNPDAPWHFDIDGLVNISQSPLLETDVKEKALQKEMALSRAGGFASENPNYMWETYEVMLDNYIQQKDYDNYLKTVNEMIERFPDSSQMDSLLEAKQQALEAIKQRGNEAAVQQDNYAQADTYTAPKAAPVQQPVKAVEPKKSEKPKASKETPELENNPMLWWLLGGGIGLLGVIVLLIRRKQS